MDAAHLRPQPKSSQRSHNGARIRLNRTSGPIPAGLGRTRPEASLSPPENRLQAPAHVPPPFQFYQLLNILIPATIIRFHMTTQRSLSAATPAPHEEPRLQWHRFTLSFEGHSCLPRGTKGLCAVAGPGSPRPATPSTSLPVQVLIASDNPTRIVILSDQRESKGLPQSLQLLIANLELKLNLSHRKLNPLKIPNRKFLTISRIASLFAARHSSLATRHCLSNPRFRD